jgi:hypothetical protein
LFLQKVFGYGKKERRGEKMKEEKGLAMGNDGK